LYEEELMRKVIICIDRDGTLINDEKFYLGKEEGWQEQVEILPEVISGLKKLNDISSSAIYMITNQAGVAIADYPLLNIDRAHEVCLYVLDRLRELGGDIAGHFLCPHATPAYVERKRGVNFHDDLVHECHCLKPGLGMVFDALRSEDVSLDEADIYVIGDRLSDVKTALNINGTGILIPFVNEPGESEKVMEMDDHSRIFIARDLLEAAEYIWSRHRD
jgi:D-glycero-D-manno-heptose 1,7-bisphosphate phosphatase